LQSQLRRAPTPLDEFSKQVHADLCHNLFMGLDREADHNQRDARRQRLPEGSAVTRVRRSVSVGIVVLALLLPAASTGRGSRLLHAQGDQSMSLVGAWTLNRDLSDAPQDRSTEGRDESGAGSGGGRGGGRRRGGGFGGGGGGFGRPGGDAGVRADPEQGARIRDAMRDIMNPPAHLTIVRTDTMIILTGPDGRTTRLSPDGKKVKDESTKTERKTKWDGAKLVSEIDGLGPGKITQTYSIDPERHQLHVDVQVEKRPNTIHHVYDADANR
jgi:hypothetical protein